jgi:hypothetical protein
MVPAVAEDQYTFLKIELYSGHPEVVAAAEVLVAYIASKKKFLKDRNGWIRAARKLIASLWMRDRDMFRFSTKKDYFSAGSRKQVWLTPKTLHLFKAMKELKWVNKAIEAVRPAYSKKKQGGLATVYCRSKTFKDLLLHLTPEAIEVDTDLPWVMLTDNDGNLKPLPEAYLSTDSYKQTLAVMQQHYDLLMRSDIKDASSRKLHDLVMRYQRKWKDHMGIGGRFYSPFCNLPKNDRLGITIRGEPVGSWDFSQLHPTLLLLLHHGVGMEQNLFSTGDVYSMPDYSDLPRSAHKKFINSIFNAQSREAAARSIMTAHRYWDLFEDCWVYETYKGRAKRQGLPVWPKSPKKAAQDYIDSFLFRHPAFEEIAFKGLWGTLQLLDSQIMQEAVKTATAMAIPVLPVHDELVVPRSQKDTVRIILIDSFHHVTDGEFKHHNPKVEWSEKEA